MPGTTTGEVLYEEMFHCSDLGTQIKAVIERFNAKAATAPAGPNGGSNVFSFVPGPADYFVPKVPMRPDGVPDYQRFILKDALDKVRLLPLY